MVYRRATREVKIGSSVVGGNHPIRIQSMTTSPTKDVEATVSQILRLEEAGCEMVRVTVQGMKEVESCEAICSKLLQKGCQIPLIADIHFYPPAAMKVIEFVDKVRINPGNFADKRALFIQKEYDDASYLEEVEKIEEVFAPLVLKCKHLQKALRIGVNHGSLSDRIMNRYGDTPRGMVESAFEFARICRKYDFHNLVFSMKSSNPLVMIEAYRLLCSQMDAMGWDYPVHLGVTEAGFGEEGRIKSALGIGSLLLDGIGDTIRVSLTEDPWEEIAPCQKLIQMSCPSKELSIPSQRPERVGLPSFFHPSGTVVLSVTKEEFVQEGFLQALGIVEGKKSLSTPEVIWVKEALEQEEHVAFVIKKLEEASVVIASSKPSFYFSVLLLQRLEDVASLSQDFLARQSWIGFAPKGSCLHEGRRLTQALKKFQKHIPVIAICSKGDIMDAAAHIGTLLLDELVDGFCLDFEMPYQEKLRMSFSLMQAARRRATKTEFISCPGCGRTLFDLQTVSRRIQEKTAHLPGVKIAIMGCIVNGPGEMADADFGYVGSKAGRVDLYIGKRCIEKDIDFAEADDKLIELIKAQGKWVENV